MTPPVSQIAGPQAVLDVVLCWHMHQPDYRLEGEWQRPWTWLHAIKDYTDMAAHLERVPGARAVVNFSPVLLQQLRDLDGRLAAALAHGTTVGEPLLDALAGHPVADEGALQRALLRANAQNMAARFPLYRRLAARAAAALAADAVLAPAVRDDLLCSYVLCWLGESLRSDRRAMHLQALESFGPDDRRMLLELIASEIAALLPRYRALAEAGIIELSVTPYSHPILPLLLDFGTAHEALPGVPLPAGGYPGGAARCDWQMREAIRAFEAAFGSAPRGCWPSEGALSTATLELLGRQGFAWTASGSAVLRNSLSSPSPRVHLRPWKLRRGHVPVCFFRDDALSDRIGFAYASWPAEAAVADFVQHLEAAQAQLGPGERCVLSIIMDGENAWEYYAGNGQAFLLGLYSALAAHPRLRLTTFSALLPEHPPRTLPRLTAGSWVHGSFSTWIGSPARNRAWDLLVEAKEAVDNSMREAGHGDALQIAEIERQLAVCEASDWFWWLDDSNPHPDVDDFDALYRAQLVVLYRLCGRPPPERLRKPLVAIKPEENAPAEPGDQGTMRRSGAGE